MANANFGFKELIRAGVGYKIFLVNLSFSIFLKSDIVGRF